MIKLVYSANMTEAQPLMQAEITAAEARGEKLTRIVYNLPQDENGELQTLLFFEPMTEAKQ